MARIPVANIYYLLCYAWNEFAPVGLTQIATEQFADTLHLFGHILAAGVRNLHRSGLETGYRFVEESTTTIRGRILLSPSLRMLASNPHRLVCSFDQLTVDILSNQILRSTIGNLLAVESLNNSARAELRAADRLLAGVTTIALSARSFHQVQLHRNNRLYPFLLNICRFFYESLQPVERRTGWRFQEPAAEPERMRRIFEKFVRNFYANRQTAYKVTKDRFNWVGHGLDGSDFTLVPGMETDVTLRSPARTIVVECKYVEALYDSRFFVQKLRAAHLYQLAAYLRNVAAAAPEGNVEGILLYPVTENRIRQVFVLLGYRTSVATVNLDQDWPLIEKELLQLLELASPDC